MKNKNDKQATEKVEPKKVWIMPDLEIISSDIITSGNNHLSHEGKLNPVSPSFVNYVS